MMRTFAAIATQVLVLGLALAGDKPSKPNLTGEWKLDIAHSDFGQMPAPQGMTMKISHEDPSLKITTMSVGGPQGDYTSTAAYTTDGKECINQLAADQDSKSRLHWDGDALRVEAEMYVGGTTLEMKGMWTVSGDGKTLTQATHLEVPQDEGDITSTDVRYVFEKESP